MDREARHTRFEERRNLEVPAEVEAAGLQMRGDFWEPVYGTRSVFDDLCMFRHFKWRQTCTLL